MIHLNKETAIEIITAHCRYNNHFDSKIESMLRSKGIIQDGFDTFEDFVSFLKDAHEKTLTMILEYF